jgi:hypothetical protein
MPPQFVETKIVAHQSFAKRLVSEGPKQQPTSVMKSIAKSIKPQATDIALDPTIVLNPERDPRLNADPKAGGTGPLFDPKFRPDVGSTLRIKRRSQVLESAHNSLARHRISTQAKYQHRDLFQNRLRLNHISGKYEDSNWADPSIPVAGVGITLEQNLIASLLLPAATISELRVSSIDPDGAVGLNRRIRVGDILLKVTQSF